MVVLGFSRLIGYQVESNPHSKQPVIPILSVCEALSHPADYDGKIVRIRDRILSTEEGVSFFGEHCPGIYVTEGKVWPSAITWTMPTQTDTILHPVDFSFDWSTHEKLRKRAEEIGKQNPGRCIALTYTGMFEVWTKKNARKPYRNGWIEIPGFGHLNAAGAQLVLKSADDVEVIPNCTAKK